MATFRNRNEFKNITLLDEYRGSNDPLTSNCLGVPVKPLPCERCTL